jgi:hypothetical protein
MTQHQVVHLLALATVLYSDGAAPARTDAANATDIWFFFTPDGGSTYYGSIPIKNAI